MIPIEEEVIQQIDIINGYDKGMTTIVETTLPPAGHINHEKEAVVDITEVEVQKKRKGKAKETLSEINYIAILRAALQKWDWNKGFPTIENVCRQPINRFNISLTFSTLLELHKQRYVILIETTATLEIEHIEKGPEFY